jgi:hypothetical protein
VSAAPAETPDDAWSSPARVSGIVRRPASPRRAPPLLLAVAMAVFAVGFASGVAISRTTAPRVAARPTRAPTAVAQPPRALVPAPPPAAPAPVAPTVAAAALAAPPEEDPALPGLTAAQVVAVQRAHAGRTRDCVNRARRSHPDLAGTARVSVFIASSGRVRNALWTRAAASQTRAVGCIADAIRGWRFPPTGYAGDFVAVLPFDLRTGARPAP